VLAANLAGCSDRDEARFSARGETALERRDGRPSTPNRRAGRQNLAKRAPFADPAQKRRSRTAAEHFEKSL
jgi:hypothetical protein